MSGRREIVVLGMMTKIPVAGVVWQTLHYLLGLRRMGYDVYYVESHARTPSMLMRTPADDGSALAAAFIDRVMRRFDMSDRWAYVALHDDGRCYGLGAGRLARVYGSAELVINLHGGTVPRPEHHATDRLVYVETDPVQLQVELHESREETLAFLEPHCAFFTFGERYGTDGCGLPVTDRFEFRPTRQPVVLDLWRDLPVAERPAFTTVANWRQDWREVTLDGEVYHWSKHREFARVMDLPARTGAAFELALSGCDEQERADLRTHGWSVRDAELLSSDIDAYRDYVAASRGEFTVAKDQNVRLATGWFSDRSATYLAAGRPVVTQDTGFGGLLPTGEGLFPFATIDEAADAIARIASDEARHRRAAAGIAAEFFDHEAVLRPLLEHVDVAHARAPRRTPHPAPFPAGLDLRPVSRRPTVLPPETVAAVRSVDVGRLVAPLGTGRPRVPRVSVIVVAHDGDDFTRLCLDSVVANGPGSPLELVVVDNASSDGTARYLAELADHVSGVVVLRNEENVGFPRGANQGLRLARGDVLVLLNNDTVVPPGWLAPLLARLEDPTVGLVGPCTNRIGNEAEVEAPYATYGELVRFAAARARAERGRTTEISMPAMFCVAMRRAVYATVGPLDERFGLGTLEDDDYAERIRAAGLRTVLAEDSFVHHFGEASFGRLVPTGEFSALIASNRERFARKWGREWEPYARRGSASYARMGEGLREAIAAACPPGSTIMVVSRGDEELVSLDGRLGWHFPRGEDGSWAGHYPADGTAAVAHLDELHQSGARYLVVPSVALWWLDHYDELQRRLAAAAAIVETEHGTVFDLGEIPAMAPAGRPAGLHVESA